MATASSPSQSCTLGPLWICAAVGTFSLAPVMLGRIEETQVMGLMGPFKIVSALQSQRWGSDSRQGNAFFFIKIDLFGVGTKGE